MSENIYPSINKNGYAQPSAPILDDAPPAYCAEEPVILSNNQMQCDINQKSSTSLVEPGNSVQLPLNLEGLDMFKNSNLTASLKVSERSHETKGKLKSISIKIDSYEITGELKENPIYQIVTLGVLEPKVSLTLNTPTGISLLKIQKTRLETENKFIVKSPTNNNEQIGVIIPDGRLDIKTTHSYNIYDRSNKKIYSLEKPTISLKSEMKVKAKIQHFSTADQKTTIGEFKGEQIQFYRNFDQTDFSGKILITAACCIWRLGH